MDEGRLLEKIEEIKRSFFADSEVIKVEKAMTAVPLVAANVAKSTHSFTKGQLLYIYGGYWGMAERLKVIGRFRRSHRFVKGVCPIKSLENHRPQIVYDPAVIHKLVGESISLRSIIGLSSY